MIVHNISVEAFGFLPNTNAELQGFFHFCSLICIEDLVVCSGFNVSIERDGSLELWKVVTGRTAYIKSGILIVNHPGCMAEKINLQYWSTYRTFLIFCPWLLFNVTSRLDIVKMFRKELAAARKFNISSIKSIPENEYHPICNAVPCFLRAQSSCSGWVSAYK